MRYNSRRGEGKKAINCKTTKAYLDFSSYPVKQERLALYRSIASPLSLVTVRTFFFSIHQKWTWSRKGFYTCESYRYCFFVWNFLASGLSPGKRMWTATSGQEWRNRNCHVQTLDISMSHRMGTVTRSRFMFWFTDSITQQCSTSIKIFVYVDLSCTEICRPLIAWMSTISLFTRLLMVGNKAPFEILLFNDSSCTKYFHKPL